MARMKKTMETPGEFNIDDAFSVIDKLKSICIIFR